MIFWTARGRLAGTSIRGRVAYCAACLERVMSELGIRSKRFADLIETLWEFTNSAALDDWEEKILKIAPSSAAELRSWITADVGFPEDAIYALVQNSLDTARGNLYGGVVGKSRETLAPCLNVRPGLRKLGITPPDPALFARSRFREEGGWGFARPKEFFVSV